MKIKKHMVPSVTYTLTVDGKVVDKAGTDHPLTFIQGIGMMVPGFEKNLEGLMAGQSYEFTLKPDEAYGEYEKEALVKLPLSAFTVDGVVKSEFMEVGKTVPMQDQHGHPMNGVVVAVDKESVTMDFNHALAGKQLHFTGEILNVRAATADELDHGHIHGPGGHHH